MRNTISYIVLILLSTPVNLFSQKTIKQDIFNYEVKGDEGDLNHDKIKDKVVVDMDIKDGTRPLQFQIFLSQPNSKKLKLVVSTTKLIESQYPKEKRGEHSDGNIPDFIIEKGILQMVTDIRDLKSRYNFKYRNGNFELNSIERVIFVGNGITKETRINFVKGTKLEYDQGYYNISNKKTKKISIIKLPKIQDLTFSDLEAF